jgi:hypothetical protein
VRWIEHVVLDARRRTLPAADSLTVSSPGGRVLTVTACGITVDAARTAVYEAASKLRAARALGIGVIVIERPAPSGAPTVSSVAEATAWLASIVKRAAVPDETPAGVTGGVR